MNTDWVLSEYFEEDKKIDQKGYLRSSVLLTLIRDLEFCLHYPRRWKSLNLTKEQSKALEDILPNFASLSLFCAGIDLIARVYNKISSKNIKGHSNKALFTHSAQTFFGFTSDESVFLWELRCAVSHQYTILSKVQLTKHGSSEILIKNSDIYMVYLAPTLTRLTKATDKLHKYILDLDGSNQDEYKNYLLKYGFIYSPTDLVS